MKKYYYKDLAEKQKISLLNRTRNIKDDINSDVASILKEVKNCGMKSAIKYAKKFDNYSSLSPFVTSLEIEDGAKLLSKSAKKAINTAYKNIYKFHSLQKRKDIDVKISDGIKCSLNYLPINSVGLYIPGGTAVLPSTLLMLAIPSKIAGCKRVVIATPVKEKVDPHILFIAKMLGITEILKIGGAQGIGLLAYGDKSFKSVDKIFGPGNRYVTEAKNIISIDPKGCAIDMPAGPSEVLIIADRYANPIFTASDLLSQAEHGTDSSSILVTNSEEFADLVLNELSIQLKTLFRGKFIKESLKNSYIIITEKLEDAFTFSNEYAPEHLIVQVKNYNKYKRKIQNAGSVFLGNYSPESAGDYASGTNHTLPTNGFAKSISGVTLSSFQKSITFQELSKKGLETISDTIITLAEIEKLDAHANAIKVRR
ncbi:MAG: histidinol dehydrogenase [Melioribacteraceae bacterium]|nr:histidinol dehydrogenase [Melioribacteraceae bacterium]